VERPAAGLGGRGGWGGGGGGGGGSPWSSAAVELLGRMSLGKVFKKTSG